VRRGRLRLTVYLGTMVFLFVVGGMLAAFLIVDAKPESEIRVASKHIAANLTAHRGDPARLDAELAELRATKFRVSMFDPARRPIASTTSPPLPARWIDHPSERPEFTFVDEVREGGQVVAIVICQARPPPTQTMLAGLGVLVASLVLLVIVISRHISGPMQRLGDAARRFGQGDLSARARITRKDELGEAGRAFDEMADRVTLLMSTQRELMANVSHELQTPLARIQVAVDLMTDGMVDQSRELLPEISTDLAEVERLIEDVMMLARLELAQAEGLAAGTPLRREPTPIADVIERAVSRFRATHPARALVVADAPDLPTLTVDPVLLRRVLDNLLENARKYSEADTTIRVETRATPGAVTIAVVDHGIGIDGADLARMFTPFFRTDRSRGRTTGGVGLGLVLARRVIEAHGGTIRITSEPQQGTTVTFELPRDH
jgi:two-component system, OmpR family, sensor kinase